MSDISNSSSIYNSSKRRLDQIDDAIEYLSQEVNGLGDSMFKTEFQCSLLSMKMKREKLKAYEAFARAQNIMTEMELMIAASEINTDVEKLRNSKKMKLEREGGKYQKDSQEANSKASQTTKSKIKKHRHSSSRKSVDLSSEETVIIPPIDESNATCKDTPELAKTSFSLDLFRKSLTDKSDSEVSLSSSVKAAFNEPYTPKSQTQQETIKKSPAKKLKTDKKESKSKKHASKRNVSPTERSQTDHRKTNNINMTQILPNSLQINTPNTNKTSDQKVTASNSLVPIRHNMPAILTPPNTSNRSPQIYVNPATQTSAHYYTQRPGTSHTFTFYGNKQ